MKKKNYIAVALLCVFICIALLSSGTTFNNFKRTFFADSTSDKTIRVGVLEPLSGVYKDNGIAQLEGILLANKLKPKAAGMKIEIIEADTQGSVYVAESAIADLLDKDPTLVLGSCGDAVTLTAAEKFEKAKIPAITPTATNPLITENHRYYFGMSFGDAAQGNIAAEYIRNNLGLDKAAVIRTEGDISTSEMVRTFQKKFKEETDEASKGKVITIDLAIKDNNYDSYIKKLKKEKIKAVFAPVSIVEAEKLFDSAKKLKASDILFIGPESWHTNDMKFMMTEYPDLKIMASADMASAMKESKEYEKFVKEFKKEYNRVPSEENARAFDAYMVAVEALEKTGGKGGDKCVKAMLNTKDFPAVTGNVSFNKTGGAVKQINLDFLSDGKWKTVFTVKN